MPPTTGRFGGFRESASLPGESGWREGACKEEGANYLRRLKTGDQPSTDPRVIQGDKLAAAMQTLGFTERREAPRIRCSGSVEFQAPGSEARMWGTLTDISLHGCYVEMTNTFPVDT